MGTKELLLLLNQKAHKQGYSYVIQYNYQYSQTYNQLYNKILLIEYNHSKLVRKIRLKNDFHTIEQLTILLNKYTNHEAEKSD